MLSTMSEHFVGLTRNQLRLDVETRLLQVLFGFFELPTHSRQKCCPALVRSRYARIHLTPFCLLKFFDQPVLKCDRLRSGALMRSNPK